MSKCINPKYSCKRCTKPSDYVVAAIPILVLFMFVGLSLLASGCSSTSGPKCSRTHYTTYTITSNKECS